MSILLLMLMPAPKKEEAAAPSAAVTQQAAAEPKKIPYWGDEADSGSDKEKKFVFGEPMTSTDPVTAATQSAPETPPNPATSGTQQQRIELAQSVARAGTPAPGAPGSKENPVDLSPTTTR
ncbi:MAG: hypothetical protein U5J78_02310 [Parasphingorhabdus sp.]|nr:hypothetical protein [Parasphingorhabdus sp.]